MDSINIYSVYDSKADAYMKPWFMHNDGVAIRAFTDIVNDPEHEFHRHAEDYHLVKVGVWKEGKGTITAAEFPAKLTRAIDLLNKKDQ